MSNLEDSPSRAGAAVPLTDERILELYAQDVRLKKANYQAGVLAFARAIERECRGAAVVAAGNRLDSTSVEVEPPGAPPSEAAKPVAYMWQHEETGNVGFVDPWQVENGWQAANPRLRIVSPLFASLPVGGAPADSRDALDAKRLDWLDSLNATLNRRYGTTYGWRLVLSPNIVRLMSEKPPVSGGFVADIDLNDAEARGFTSCRAAIDAAMALSATDATTQEKP
jgi:hypothetical protein